MSTVCYVPSLIPDSRKVRKIIAMLRLMPLPFPFPFNTLLQVILFALNMHCITNHLQHINGLTLTHMSFWQRSSPSKSNSDLRSAYDILVATTISQCLFTRLDFVIQRRLQCFTVVLNRLPDLPSQKYRKTENSCRIRRRIGQSLRCFGWVVRVKADMILK